MFPFYLTRKTKNRLINNMVFSYLKKVYGSSVIAANLIGQQKLPFMRREKLDSIRDRRIRRIVRYAAGKVPYYRDWFIREKIDPREIRGAADLDTMPILDKELVRAQPRLFVADGPASRDALSFRTSGTTGVPIEIYHDQRSILANIAFGERERAPFIRICGGSFRPRELYVGYETSTFKTVTAFYKESVLFPVKPLRRFVSILEPIDKIAEILNTERPDILVGYGGWINLFFRTAAARKIEFHHPKMVMYIGEALPHGTREYIEGTLGIPVLTRYNAVESFKIGFYCQDRLGFHIHEDLCHIRIADAKGKNATVGEPGEVVISNLVNRASVLLNYPMGDMASIAPESCTCGRTFKLLSELDGRTEDILPLADGRFIHPRTIWQVFKDEREVLQYQLVQEKPRLFVLQVVTLNEAAFSLLYQGIYRKLKDLLGEDAQIDIHWRPDIIQKPGQKFRVVVSRRNEEKGK